MKNNYVSVGTLRGIISSPKYDKQKQNKINKNKTQTNNNKRLKQNEVAHRSNQRKLVHMNY